MKKLIVSLLLVFSAIVGTMAQSANASLKGRTVLGTLPTPKSSFGGEGVVVVSIWVDQYGNVQKAIPGAQGTTLVDSKVWANARKAAMEAHFNMSGDAPSLQEGTIAYRFRIGEETDAAVFMSRPRTNMAVSNVTVKDIVENQHSGFQCVKAKFYQTYSTAELLFSIEDEDYIIPVKLVKKDLGATKRFEDLSLSDGDSLVIKGRVAMIRVDGDFYTGLEDAVIIDKIDKKGQTRELDFEPSFKGEGKSAFAEWVNSQLQYPKVAKENGIQGRVTLQFTIKADGSVTDVKVIRGAEPELDKEAIRVVSQSPKWTPGYSGGKPVDVDYTFPVIFQLR